MNGWVAKLAIPKSKPNLLFALVQKDKDPEKTGGLYIFDVSNGNNPKQISHYYVNSASDFVISPDGNTMFLQSRHFINSLANDWYGVAQLDISNPENIRETGKITGEISNINLSIDGRYLFTSPTGGTYQPPSFHVFNINQRGDPQEVGGATAKPPQFTMGIFPTQEGKLLLVDAGHSVITFDISDPSAPKQISTLNDQFGKFLGVGVNGLLYWAKESGMVVTNGYAENIRLGTAQDKFNTINNAFLSNEDSRLYITTYDHTLHVFDVSNAKAPRLVARYTVPQSLGAVTTSTHSNLIYVGLNGAIAVIDPAHATISASQLIAAHAEALAQYKRNKNLKDTSQRIEPSVNILKAAGIDSVVDNKLSGISDKQLAEILNDYGFLLERSLYSDEEKAISIYKRAINVDPNRAVAYLNLGDSLRRQLSFVNEFQVKIDQSKEIKAAYVKYKQLTDRSTSDIDNFLSLNIVDNPITDFCKYVSAYNSHERLHEIFGKGESVLEESGQNKMRIETGYEGTAHVPVVKLIDIATQKDITETDADVKAANENEDTRWAQNIRAVPFYDGYHLLYYNGTLSSRPNSGELIKAFPIGRTKSKGAACTF